VIVVGVGTSACDAAVDLSSVCSQVNKPEVEIWRDFSLSDKKVN